MDCEAELAFWSKNAYECSQEAQSRVIDEDDLIVAK